jgi:hypothetical protein
MPAFNESTSPYLSFATACKAALSSLSCGIRLETSSRLTVGTSSGAVSVLGSAKKPRSLRRRSIRAAGRIDNVESLCLGPGLRCRYRARSRGSVPRSARAKLRAPLMNNGFDLLTGLDPQRVANILRDHKKVELLRNRHGRHTSTSSIGTLQSLRKTRCVVKALTEQAPIGAWARLRAGRSHTASAAGTGRTPGGHIHCRGNSQRNRKPQHARPLGVSRDKCSRSACWSSDNTRHQ